MSNKAFTQIAEGLQEALSVARKEAEPASRRSLPLPQSDARSFPVFSNEDHSRFFKGALDHVQGGITGLRPSALELAHGDNTDARSIGKLLLRPIEKSATSAALCGRNHGSCISRSIAQRQNYRKSLDLSLIIGYQHNCRFSTDQEIS